MRQRAALRTLIASLLLGAGPGCSQTPTEVVLIVDSDLAVPGEIDGVEIVVLGPGGGTTTLRTDLRAEGAPRFPLTVGLEPEGDVLGPVEVTATARRGGSG